MQQDKGKINQPGSNPEKSFETGRKGGSSPIDAANKSSNQVNNSKPTGQQNIRSKQNNQDKDQSSNFID